MARHYYPLPWIVALQAEGQGRGFNARCRSLPGLFEIVALQAEGLRFDIF